MDDHGGLRYESTRCIKESRSIISTEVLLAVIHFCLLCIYSAAALCKRVVSVEVTDIS